MKMSAFLACGAVAMHSAAALAQDSPSAPPLERDRRPIHAYAALPRVGAALPEFDFPLVGGGSASPSSLRGAPAVLVLWSTHCPWSRQTLTAVEALRAELAPQGVRVLLVAQDALTDARRFADSAGVRTPIAAAGGAMVRTFDHSATAPEADSVRVAFALPSTLVVDGAGRVVHRDGVPDLGRLRAVLAALSRR